MKRRRVVVSLLANEQIRAHVIFIARDSIDEALAWEDRLRAAIGRLKDFAGYAVDEDASDRLGYTLHKLVFERLYLVHFVVDDATDTVSVVNVRHGSRTPLRGEP